MNKRIKKKRELVEQVQGTKAAVAIVLDLIKSLLDENDQQAKEIAELRELVERNAQATNSELEIIKLDATKLGEQVGQLKSATLAMRTDLSMAVLEFKKAKKPFWKR